MVVLRQSSYKTDIVLFWVIFELKENGSGGEHAAAQVHQHYLSRSFREPDQGFIVG